jgi:hypothetical protein
LATQKSHPRIPGRKPKSGPTQTLLIRVRRCSRPLCSSQRTTRNRPPTDARPDPPTGAPAVRQQTGPARQRPPLSGAARSLRTQQRAYEPPHPRRPPSTPTRRHAVLRAGNSRRPNWSAFHPRAPSRTPAATPRRDDHHGPSTALHHTPTRMR